MLPIKNVFVYCWREKCAQNTLKKTMTVNIKIWQPLTLEITLSTLPAHLQALKASLRSNSSSSRSDDHICSSFNSLEWHSMETTFLWIIYWEDCISLGPPLERWHAAAVVGLSRLCAQPASLQGQTTFCIFMAGFTTRKWSFPRL